MDYYLSGDFEGPKAQKHYREKLVRLPNLGAAQLPPLAPSAGKMKRQDFGLPDDASTFGFLCKWDQAWAGT